MLSIARLFGKSPFAPLQSHMQKVARCLETLEKIFSLLPKENAEKIEQYLAELSALEHEADISKNDIRNHLPKSIFLPINRALFLETLAIQDAIADQAESVGVLLALKPLHSLQRFYKHLSALFTKNGETFSKALEIIQEIDALLESSFGGIEAEKVRGMVEQAAYLEYQAELLRRSVMKKLVQCEEEFPAPSFYQWVRVVEEIAEIAKLSEKLANRFRMVLELK